MVSQGQVYKGTSPVTKKVSTDFLESRFIIMQMSDPLFSETMFPRLATGVAKQFVYFLLI